MSEQLTVQEQGKLLENVLIQGDLKRLTSEQKVLHLKSVCQSLGLNPLTRPFEYIELNGKLTLYAKRDATDQLRKLHNVSIRIVDRKKENEVFVVTAQATLADGRTDESIGAVTVGHLKGDAFANAIMKAETKAKRRVTLSICGMGFLDETEVESIPDAKPPRGAPAPYRVPVGRFKGKTLDDIHPADLAKSVVEAQKWLSEGNTSSAVQEFIDLAETYLDNEMGESSEPKGNGSQDNAGPVNGATGRDGVSDLSGSRGTPEPGPSGPDSGGSSPQGS